MAVRIAVDIGGTFTDVALDRGAARLTTEKLLTTHGAPEEAAVEGVLTALAAEGLAPADADLVIHGTTLATNALIERRGAKTALVATEGFRDTLEIGYEDRYDQYDLTLIKPEPLVPKALRFAVPERVAVDGTVLAPLDEDAVHALGERLAAAGVEAVAVAFIHAYRRPDHEERAAELLAKMLPGVEISVSSAVSPEAREYERTMTTVVNAYVAPLMAGYLGRLAMRLDEAGVTAPVLMMTSGGGLTTLATARRFPVRLVESGPAGGAILAAEVARACGEDRVLSFDMGGTTAKLCLVDGGAPKTARAFEVDRQARFKKGSGLPIRIPVINMIEIGAGGGSIARVDALSRIAVGPQSAGSEPGPAAYGRGGTRPTVTDADLLLGRLDPAEFAGGRISLDRGAADAALSADVGEPLGLGASAAARGVAEIVDEAMANAARVHAVENGADVAERTLIAFGGAAPLHAARLADKLGLSRVIVPADAGVGSAVGFLAAPVAFEVVRTLTVRLSRLDPAAIEALYAELDADIREVVASASPGVPIRATRTAYLRYLGQGHEVPVPVPEPLDAATLRAAFEEAYRAAVGRTIANAEVEALSWSLVLAADAPPLRLSPPERVPAPTGRRTIAEGEGEVDAAVHPRRGLAVGTPVKGPALVTEPATTTVVPSGFTATLDAAGHLILERTEGRSGHDGGPS